MPQISVIVPTCDRPELLQRALTSILKQTFQDLEVIIVDDSQVSKAERAVKSFNETRFIYLANEKKLGGAAARNRGIRKAQGRWIAFLDDDDEWETEKLSLQMSALQSAGSEAGFCFSSVVNVFDDREEVTTVSEGVGDYLNLALRRFNGFLTSTLVIRKDILEEVDGFDENFPSHQEPDLIIRISQKYKGLGLNQPLVRMSQSRLHEHVGSKLERRIAGRQMILSKHFELFRQFPLVLARHYFRLGLWSRDIGQFQSARSYFYQAWWTHFSVRYFLHYLSLMVPGQPFLRLKKYFFS